MSTEGRILIIEDEPSIAETLIYALEQERFACQSVSLGADAINIISHFQPDLLLLDVGLPDMSGFEVCKTLRQHSHCPIIFLTARSDEIDRILGFELGADDYVVKPFSPREVVSRVKAVLRRCQPQTGLAPNNQSSPVAESVIGPFRWNQAARRILFFETALQLTRYEYGILALLLQQPKRIYTRDQLIENVWSSPETSMDRVIDTHIKTIRAKLRKIQPDYPVILTHRGIGYSIDWENNES